MDLSQRIAQLSVSAHEALSQNLSSHQWAQGASDLLDEHFSGYELNPSAILCELINREIDPRATFPSLGFSHHPVTLLASDLFNLDLYFWLPSDTLPHDHGFHGAFMPLWGDYAQTLFEFHEKWDLGEGVITGELIQGETRLLPHHKAHPIFHAPAFLHAVLHESFCVTLVLRSKNQGEVLSDYYPRFRIKNQPAHMQQALADWQRLDLLTHLQVERVPELLKGLSTARLVRMIYLSNDNSRLRVLIEQESLTRDELK